MGEPWFMTKDPMVEGPLKPIIDGRKHFDLILPQEPGVYRFEVMTWTSAFLSSYERDGTRNPKANWTGTSAAHSNILFFEVLPPQ